MSGKSENFWKPRALKAEKCIADLERELGEWKSRALCAEHNLSLSGSKELRTKVNQLQKNGQRLLNIKIALEKQSDEKDAEIDGLKAQIKSMLDDSGEVLKVQREKKDLETRLAGVKARLT